MEIKKVAASLAKNARNSVALLHSTPIGASYARWMAAGAVIGGIRGLSDNIVGQDRVSVLGGALQGAMMGGAARGVGHLWSMRGNFGAGKIKSMSRAAGARNVNAFRGATMASTPEGSAIMNTIINRARGRAGVGYYGKLPGYYKK